MSSSIGCFKAEPVFGFQTEACRYKVPKEEFPGHWVTNGIRVVCCIPGFNTCMGLFWIVLGVRLAVIGSEKAKEEGVEHLPLKVSAFVIRGVVTLGGGGVLFLIVDVITTIGRACLREHGGNCAR